MKKIYLLAIAVFCIITVNAQNFNISFQSNLQYPGQVLSNIWGHVDSLGNEYALVGAENGLSIVNVTDPANPFEVIQIPGPSSNWREVKTWGNYAYVTTEANSVQGLQIVNLSNLPGTSIPSKYWSPNISGNNLTTIHALHIDNGYAYLYGSNISPGGMVMANLSDPWNPVYEGIWNQEYVHDGIVRNDTAYACNIYSGHFTVIDVTDKANPVAITTQQTPSNFTHNSWLSDDSKTLFTTDEVSDSYLTTYDITNLNNITELDRFQTIPGSGSIVHNTYILNDYAVTSWYTDGVSIVDGHRPQNLVEVARYDTYPQGSGDGFNGDWGVYPYLPSGNLVISNIEDGLYVLSPTYNRACYLEGHINDSICGSNIKDVKVRIVGANAEDKTNMNGDYKTGTVYAGTYTIEFTKTGYDTIFVNNVVLSPGVVTTINLEMFNPSLIDITGLAESNGSAVSGVSVNIFNSSYSYNFVTDASGNFNSCDVVPGNYSIVAGKWGYQTYCASGVSVTNPGSTVNIELIPMIYDDFAVNTGWVVSGNAATGAWEIGIPNGTSNQGTPSNPGVDATGDCSNKAYVTGNNGGSAGDDDVDGGATILTSPLFDLSAYTEPFIKYSRWFYNSGGTGSPNDSLKIMINNGITTVTLETVLASSPGNSTWKSKGFRLKDFIVPTAAMKLIVRTADMPDGHLVEAGFDKFSIIDSTELSSVMELNENVMQLTGYPNPFENTITVNYNLDSEEGSLVIRDVIGKVIETVSLQSKNSNLNVGTKLPSGIYLLELRSRKSLKVIRIVKSN